MFQITEAIVLPSSKREARPRARGIDFMITVLGKCARLILNFEHCVLNFANQSTTH
jgi:hypothetical protein